MAVRTGPFSGSSTAHYRPAAVPREAPAHHRLAWLGRPFEQFGRRIADKIVVPYLVLIFVLGVLASHTTMTLIAGTLEEKFREELASAGRSANEAMVRLEFSQLAVLRQMVFTVGVDEALEQRDADRLQELLAPVALNARARYVDVFAPDGTQLLALRSPDLGVAAAEQFDPAARHWPPIEQVLGGQSDALGDKHAGVVFAPWGPLLVSTAPVLDSDRLLGAVSVAVPLEEVVARISTEAGSKGVTVYTNEGAVVASTVFASAETLSAALGLSPPQIETVYHADQLFTRRAAVDGRPFVETIGVLAVRGETALLLGIGNVITIVEERGAETRITMIVLFSSVVLAVLGIGLLLARRIARPVKALVEATNRIRRNELDFELPVQTKDETGILTAAFNEMTGGLREREKSRVAIERYMSPKVYRLIQAGELKMGGESREITVFKTDIRGFTSISETMQPEELIDFLNQYFAAMVAPITKYEGEVDKYMGDAILAKFGATEWYPDHARRAVLAMIEMIEACERFSTEIVAQGKPPLRMGIGCNTGLAVVGNLGSLERMEYTIISDAVNTAQRIEELCKEYGWDLLISEQTYQQVQDVVEVGRPWIAELRGQTRPTAIFPVLGRRGEVSPTRRQGYRVVATHREVVEPTALLNTPRAGAEARPLAVSR